jgi:hypothetical protein
VCFGKDVVDVFTIIDVYINTHCLRGRGFKSPWGHLCFLILARRGMYGGMRMSFAVKVE